MQGQLSAAWFATIVEDLRHALQNQVSLPSQAPSFFDAFPAAARGGQPLDVLREVIEGRGRESEAPDCRFDMEWARRLHEGLLDALKDTYGTPVPNRHGPFIPEALCGPRIMEMTRSLCRGF